MFEESLQDKVNEHAVALARFEVILDQVAKSQLKIVDSIELMAKNAINQELLLEKVTNLEDRLDTKQVLIDLEIKDIKEKSKELDLVRMLIKYPWILVTVGVGLYVMAIKEVRDVILS